MISFGWFTTVLVFCGLCRNEHMTSEHLKKNHCEHSLRSLWVMTLFPANTTFTARHRRSDDILIEFESVRIAPSSALINFVPRRVQIERSTIPVLGTFNSETSNKFTREFMRTPNTHTQPFGPIYILYYVVRRTHGMIYASVSVSTIRCYRSKLCSYKQKMFVRWPASVGVLLLHHAAATRCAVN